MQLHSHESLSKRLAPLVLHLAGLTQVVREYMKRWTTNQHRWLPLEKRNRIAQNHPRSQNPWGDHLQSNPEVLLSVTLACTTMAIKACGNWYAVVNIFFSQVQKLNGKRCSLQHFHSQKNNLFCLHSQDCAPSRQLRESQPGTQ